MSNSGPFFGIPPIAVVAIVIMIIIFISRSFMKKGADKIISDLAATGAKIKFAGLALLADSALHKRGLLILLEDRLMFISFMGHKRLEMTFPEISRVFKTKPGAFQLTSIDKNQVKIVFEMLSAKHVFVIFKDDLAHWIKAFDETPQMKEKTAIDD